MFTQLLPVLYVPDLDAEVKFYQVLGFSISHQDGDFVAMKFGTSILFGLQRREGFRVEGILPQMVWQIGVRSASEVYVLCVEKGLPVVYEPRMEAWGCWTVAVRSPGGYEVVFEEY
ncbi:MAG: VOC family protein, partial [bacterium]|nr:VOC family protein [bacterium]